MTAGEQQITHLGQERGSQGSINSSRMSRICLGDLCRDLK